MCHTAQKAKKNEKRKTIQAKKSIISANAERSFAGSYFLHSADFFIKYHFFRLCGNFRIGIDINGLI